MTAINLVFEAGVRWLLSESLAYDFYRRAGQAAPRTEFVRLVVDGQSVPFHLLIEQPNKAFLRKHRRRDDGDLYKATWAGDGIEGTHEKRTHRRTGHGNLVRLVESLENAKDQPEEQWKIIRREFDTEQVINHYAVRTLLSDWDGFFNNYFLYHDVEGTKKWTFFPWDQDKTWGEYDGWEQNGPLYEMPMNYGAEGDHPPGEPGGQPSTSYGFRDWWRAGGVISRPLLANPIFRRHFLARLKELLDTEFTGERIGPMVDALKAKLEDEVKSGSPQSNRSPDDAVRSFESHLASYKEFVARRRAFLLKQPEVKNAGPFRRGDVQ
ncbi:MAG: CotH kinase family protein [Verrucomicrobiales bacterium]|nr:CotH kinase family protein [Verrucomicrobiales bacterium]